MDFTGFMVGWAENAARYVKGKPEKTILLLSPMDNTSAQLVKIQPLG